VALIRRRRALRADRATVVLGAVASALGLAVVGAELSRIWRRSETVVAERREEPLLAAAETVAETAAVVRRGYGEVSTTENALFNLFASFGTTFIAVRAVTTLLRDRRRVGPFRDLVVGRRHIHHFVPGIVLSLVSGSVAIATRREEIEPLLAIPFGVGMGLTLDESALLLELDDVYWSEEGILSVQIALAALAVLSATALATRFLRRGEQLLDPPLAGTA